jgi:hypothetical protein
VRVAAAAQCVAASNKRTTKIAGKRLDGSVSAGTRTHGTWAGLAHTMGHSPRLATVDNEPPSGTLEGVHLVRPVAVAEVPKQGAPPPHTMELSSQREPQTR